MGARRNFRKRWGCMVFEDVFSGSIEMGKIYSVYYSVMTKTDKTGFKSIRFLLSRLLYITDGKYWNQLKRFLKFPVVLSSGSHETGSTAKKSYCI